MGHQPRTLCCFTGCDPGAAHTLTVTETLVLLDAEFLDAVSKCAKAHPEQLRCGRLVIAGLFQRLDDCVTLDVLELRAERTPGGNANAGNGGRSSSRRGCCRQGFCSWAHSRTHLDVV